MGVSVSAAVAIIFTGFVVSASIFLAVFDSTTNKLFDASSRSNDDLVDRVQTDIKIKNATYNWTILTLTIIVENSGSTTLNPEKAQILIDGLLKTNMINWAYSNIDGGLSRIWGPKTNFNIVVSGLYYPFGEHPNSIKIVTQNCISDYTTDIYIPP